MLQQVASCLGRQSGVVTVKDFLKIVTRQVSTTIAACHVLLALRAGITISTMFGPPASVDYDRPTIV